MAAGIERLVAQRARTSALRDEGDRAAGELSRHAGGHDDAQSRLLAVGLVAGAHLVQGVNGRALLTLSTAAFDGIMIAILARNNPLVIPIAAVLYAYLKVGGFVLEQEASVGTEIVNVIQALIVLLVTSQFVIGFMRRRKAEKKASA